MFDAHCHPGLDSDLSIVCTASPEEWDDVRHYRYHSFGLLHPVKEDVERMEKALENDPDAFAGEFGLDSRWQTDSGLVKDLISLSSQLERPFTLHVVHRHDEMLALLRQVRPQVSFIVHSFTKSAQLAREYIRLGGLISLSPLSLRTRDSAELLKLPFLLETDMKISEQSLNTLAILYRDAAHRCGIETAQLEEMIDERRTVLTT